MKKTLLIIGERYRKLDELNEFIKRRAESVLGAIDIVVYLKENDPDILFEVQHLIEKSSVLVIMCSKNYSSLISKTLATHSGDSLALKGDSLAPSKAKIINNNEYAMIVGATEIVVLFAEETGRFAKHDENSKQFCIFGRDEESAKLLLAPLAAAHDILFSVYEHCGGYLQGYAETKKYGNLDAFLQNAKKLFDDGFIVSEDAVTAALYMLDKNTVAVAESCSGGLLAHRFTSVSGASKNFIGGFVTYANESKTAWLGVLPSIIQEYGAVSAQTVEQMLDGALQASGASYALAISGIAGPSGGSEDKPVGLVFIGLGTKNGEKIIKKMHFQGDRAWIQTSASWHAVRLLAEFLIFSKNTLDK